MTTTAADGYARIAIAQGARVGACSRFGQHLEGKTLLGRALRLDDRAVEAESVLMEVVLERPDFAKAWGELGWALSVQGNEAGVKGAFARHAQLDATTTESRFMLARIALRGGDPSEATRLLREMEAIQKANLPRLRAEE